MPYSPRETQGDESNFEAGHEARGTRNGEHLFVREGPFAGCRSQSSPKAPCNSCRPPPSFFHPNSCSCSCSMKWCSYSSSNTQGEKTGGFFEHEARGTSTSTSTSTGHGEHLFVREGPFAGCRSQSSPKAPCNSCRPPPSFFHPNSCSCSCSMKWCSYSSSNTQGENRWHFFEHEARGTRHGNEERARGTGNEHEHEHEERGTGNTFS
jgi:hypothetical protein